MGVKKDVTLTINELFGASQALQELATNKMDVPSAFRLEKLMSQIQKELQHFDNFRDDLLKKWKGEKKQEEMTPEEIDGFSKEFQELMQEKTELRIVPLDLTTIPDLKLSAHNLHAIKWFVVVPVMDEDEDEGKPNLELVENETKQ